LEHRAAELAAAEQQERERAQNLRMAQGMSEAGEWLGGWEGVLIILRFVKKTF
jgi:hypothetical protein